MRDLVCDVKVVLGFLLPDVGQDLSNAFETVLCSRFVALLLEFNCLFEIVEHL